MFERLEMYLSAGLPLDKALQTVAHGSSKRNCMILERILGEVYSGERISASFSRHLRISKTLCSLIEHGETSGNLPGSLVLARSILERQSDTFKKCTSALVYPMVIGVFALVLTLGLVRGVMPQITPMLKSLRVPLPVLTKIMITISEHVVAYGLYVCAGLVILGAITVVLYKKVAWFAYLCQWCATRIPIVGNVFFLYSISLFLRSFGSLVESGLPVPASYVSTSTTLPLLPLKRALQQKSSEIQKGVSLGVILSTVNRKVPRHVSSLVSAGELSGSLGASLVRAATIIDRDMDHSLKRLTSLIEPLMMVGMGCTVGSIALSIMMPIYDMSKVLQH
jgi:type II secretory pathway component PulF